MPFDPGKPFLYGEGVTRTEEDCTNCGKHFISKINYDLNGNHKVLCPYCHHEHWRVIQNGVMTGDRWGSQNGPDRAGKAERCWRDPEQPIETVTTAEEIRRQWLDRD